MVMENILFRIVRLSGLPYFFREIIQRNKVTIILLHDIDRLTAEMVFSYLSKYYNIIELDKVIEAIEKHDGSRLPNKAMVITIDDGNIRNYELLGLIERLKIPITIFLCAGIIGTNRHFWWNTEMEEQVRESIKQIPNKSRLATLKQYGFDQFKQYDSPQALGKEQLNEMKTRVNMQSHTLFHPCLPNCSYEEAKQEIFESKRILEQEYGFEINAFSYPNGDYSVRDVLLVKEAGYRCALTVDDGFNNIESDLFTLKRISINDTNDIDELIVKSSGAWAFLKKMIGGYQRNGRSERVDTYNE